MTHLVTCYAGDGPTLDELRFALKCFYLRIGGEPNTLRLHPEASIAEIEGVLPVPLTIERLATLGRKDLALERVEE